MLKSEIFEIVVQGTHNLIIPNNIAQPFIEAGHSRVKVKATFTDRSITFFAALRRYHGQFTMMFSKNKQKALGLLPEDYFQLQFFEDNSKYGVDVPEEFEAVMLTDYDAYQIFESFTKGKQRGIIYMITRFKNAQKKIDKTLILCENLKRGIRDNKDLLKSK
ncbi:MAG: YdeI/OmpD-associated family protein [Croceivirga sp.]|mgnify:CR=1 FL=1